MGQRFWACHNHWVGHSHFGTEATKLLRPWLFWANFEVHSGLLTDTKTWWWPCEYTTLFGPHLVYFRAPWSRKIQKSGEGLRPFEPRLKGGTPPLKIPPVVYILRFFYAFWASIYTHKHFLSPLDGVRRGKCFTFLNLCAISKSCNVFGCYKSTIWFLRFLYGQQAEWTSSLPKKAKVAAI